MKKIIQGGTLINEGRIFQADILLENDRIAEISDHLSEAQFENAEIINAQDHYVIPGVIDDQVHFREPGLTRKEIGRAHV